MIEDQGWMLHLVWIWQTLALRKSSVKSLMDSSFRWATSSFLSSMAIFLCILFSSRFVLRLSSLTCCRCFFLVKRSCFLRLLSSSSNSFCFLFWGCKRNSWETSLGSMFRHWTSRKLTVWHLMSYKSLGPRYYSSLTKEEFDIHLPWWIWLSVSTNFSHKKLSYLVGEIWITNMLVLNLVTNLLFKTHNCSRNVSFLSFAF